MRRAAWFALAAALSFASPASAQYAHGSDSQKKCATTDSAERCFKAHFKHGEDEHTKLEGKLLQEWKNRFTGAKWKQDDDCQAVKAALIELFDMAESGVSGETAEIYFALPKDNEAGFLGAYWGGLNSGTENLVVVNDTIDIQWEILQHEAAHHAGYSADHSGNFTAYDAEDCATEGEEDPNGGGSNENDPDDPGETCTTETVWVEKWEECHSWSGGSLPDLTVCFKKVYVPVEVVTCD